MENPISTGFMVDKSRYDSTMFGAFTSMKQQTSLGGRHLVSVIC